jgi:hypothetical protein
MTPTEYTSAAATARSLRHRSVVGHDDGGYLISTVYTKLSEKRAHARAQRAMDAYQQRIQDPTKQR